MCTNNSNNAKWVIIYKPVGKKSQEEGWSKKIIETSSSSSGMCSVNELCCFFLIGWQCGSVRQEGVGVWLFFSLKTVLKHHSCITVEERERERRTSSSVLLLLLSAGGERWVTSHHWQLATELISNDYVLRGLAFQAFRWMHWVRRCFMIVVHVWKILDWSWKQLYY